MRGSLVVPLVLLARSSPGALALRRDAPTKLAAERVPATLNEAVAAAEAAAADPIASTPLSPSPGHQMPLLGARGRCWLDRLWSWAPQAKRVLAGLSLATVAKVACMVGNMLATASPLPQVRRWKDSGSTGQADAAPFVSIAYGGWQWCTYGLLAWAVTKRDGFLILVYANLPGALLGSYYTLTFYRHCRDHGSAHCLQQYLSAVSALVLLQACGWLALMPEVALQLSGMVSSFCSFIGALAMLVSLPDVIRARDSSTICGPLAVANFVSALLWVYCGWLMADVAIAAPNAMAVLSSGTCILAKVRYPSRVAAGPSRNEEELSPGKAVDQCRGGADSAEGAQSAPAKAAEAEVPMGEVAMQPAAGTGGT